jgi:DNA-binding FadR family transcriptional regulator
MNVAALPVNDSQDVFNTILNDIRLGVYRPGDKMMNERSFAEAFKVSRGAVRKALDRLEKEGIVQRRVGSGTFLSTKIVSAIEIIDAEVKFDRPDKSISFNTILEARLVIEPRVVAMAANNATSDQIAAIYKDLEKIKTASCWLEFKEHIYSFFRSLYAMSNNSFLLFIFDQIIDQRRITNFDGKKLRSKVAPLVCQRTYEDLELIFTPVAAGDAEGAERKSHEYLLQQYCSQ